MVRKAALGVIGMFLSVAWVSPAAADEPMGPQDFRLYCGYLESLQDPKIQRLKPKQQLAKIARMAKVKAAKLRKIVERGEPLGDDCSKIMKAAEARIMAALQETRVKGRVEFVEVSGAQWDQMVVRARWRGDEDRYLEEEAATVAFVTYTEFPMVSELGVAAYNPADPDSAMFEGIISHTRLPNIQQARIDTFADTRYIRLFDNKKFAKPRP